MLQRCFHLFATLLGALCALGLVHAAHAAEPAQVRLAAFQVVTTVQDGAARERLQPLEKVKPGDTIEYEATYSNVTGNKVSGVQLTVPVPDGGLALVENGASPSAVLASLDGKTYQAMPLMRSVMLPDGRTVSRRVPLADIRFLRWHLGEVPAGATRSVRARMQMPALAAATPASSLSSVPSPSSFLAQTVAQR